MARGDVKTCPCCGQLLAADYGVLVSLEFNVAIVGDRAIKLFPKQAEVLFALKKAWPRKLTKDTLISHVWGANSDVLDGTVRNTIYQANLKLKPAGYMVRSCGPNSYRLEKIGQFS